MKINVHVKDKMFTIECGEGTQKIKWLGDVGIFRFEHFYSVINGTPKGVRFENGDFLDMNKKINEILNNDMHVWIVLKEDLESLGALNDFKDKNKKIQMKPDILIDRSENNMTNSNFRIRPQSSMPKYKKKP